MSATGLLMLLLQTLAPSPERAALIQFSRSTSLIYITEEIEILDNGRDPKTNQRIYETHYKWSKNQQIKKEARFDSKKCPYVKIVVDGLRNLQLLEEKKLLDRPPMVDGNHYILSTQNRYTKNLDTIYSDMGSPLAEWMEAAFKGLSPCLPKFQVAWLERSPTSN
ncbi:hypothetical protein GCM10008023_40130 [Sphingomonas glacialis]|uniref:Uncharacterized protein n=1 Tax=Sphingomonas glacialis TaxID=658225 RepID=A0ABQ3M0D6_9SPHN|nr:hypothetical protein [Sphingomonas glacialis]GHH26040.1 hypothetical protein GCM10008023_40130 [Sphingomonas glacialis]